MFERQIQTDVYIFGHIKILQHNNMHLRKLLNFVVRSLMTVLFEGNIQYFITYMNPKNYQYVIH
jgi:hypothetical protein